MRSNAGMTRAEMLRLDSCRSGGISPSSASIGSVTLCVAGGDATPDQTSDDGDASTSHNPRSSTPVADLQDLQPMLLQLLGSEIRLQLERSEAALPVHMDKSNFELMILNIAGNANDALGAEGTFRISATPDDAGRTVVLTLSDAAPT